MPLLDVTDVILDPDFCDALWLFRKTTTITEGGMTSLKATNPAGRRFFGVVTNEKGEVLRREDGSERIEGTIMVVTRERLTSGKQRNPDGTHVEADVVKWDDRSWTVVNVGPYTRFGRGFVQASCELLPFAGSDGPA